MDLDVSTKSKIEKLPLIMRMAAYYLLDCVDKIIDGKCSEAEVSTVMGTLKQNADARYGNEDLMNYDKAGNALGFGCTNRSGLKKLLDRYNIKQVVINNMRCGFLRSEIMALADKLSADVRKRELKERRKKERALEKLKMKNKKTLQR